MKKAQAAGASSKDLDWLRLHIRFAENYNYSKILNHHQDTTAALQKLILSAIEALDSPCTPSQVNKININLTNYERIRTKGEAARARAGSQNRSVKEIQKRFASQPQIVEIITKSIEKDFAYYQELKAHSNKKEIEGFSLVRECLRLEVFVSESLNKPLNDEQKAARAKLDHFARKHRYALMTSRLTGIC